MSTSNLAETASEPTPAEIEVALVRFADFITSCQMSFPYISDVEDTEALNRLARAGAGLEKMPGILQIFRHLAAKVAEPAKAESPEMTEALEMLAEIKREGLNICADQRAMRHIGDRWSWNQGRAERWIMQNADMVLNAYGRPAETL